MFQMSGEQPQQFQSQPVQPMQNVSEKPAFVSATVNPRAKSRMDELFYKMAELGASDLHLSVSMPPMVRNDGAISVLRGFKKKELLEMNKKIHGSTGSVKWKWAFRYLWIIRK